MRLGTRQIELLRQLANPWLHLIVPDKVCLSLERHGLVVARSKDRAAFYSITPKGLRTVADMMEADLIEFPLPAKENTLSKER